MMKLIYLANIRLPTEKAHGLQIMQNCEAFAAAGAKVDLWVPRRINTPELRSRDPFVHYGVEANFGLRRLLTLDLLPWLPDHGLLSRLGFGLQLLSFTLAAMIATIFVRADVFYSRDAVVLLFVSLLKPRAHLAYEAHTLASGRIGRKLQSLTLRRVGHVFATTAKLREDLIAAGASAEFTHVAHDGIRRGRFSHLPSRAAARQLLGWPVDALIVGYVGRLQTMAMDKGVGLLLESLVPVEGAVLALVGGPESAIAQLKERWIALGRREADFVSAGQVAPDEVPRYLAALDVAAMPFPWTTHFAYYASAIKLFEYMASGAAIVASDLPSTQEVVHDGETALLYPVGDGAALTDALQRLSRSPELRERLAAAARAEVFAHYTWEARAQAILAALV